MDIRYPSIVPFLASAEVECFREHVRHLLLLAVQAKAMVVTKGRQETVHFNLALKVSSKFKIN